MTNDVSIVSGDATPHQGGDNLHSVNIDDIFDDVVDEPSKISRMLSTNETTVIVEFQKRETNFAPASKNNFKNCSIGTVNHLQVGIL